MKIRPIFAVIAPLALLACAEVASASTIMVTKTATCPCCKDWVEHMKKAGFKVQVRDVEDLTPLARKLGVPDALRSCHTSQVGGYVIEGHGPAADVKRLIAAKLRQLASLSPAWSRGRPGWTRGQ